MVDFSVEWRGCCEAFRPVGGGGRVQTHEWGGPEFLGERTEVGGWVVVNSQKVTAVSVRVCGKGGEK